MPNVTTYIRKDDVGLWAACPNKAELIHNALRMREDYIALSDKERGAVKAHISSMPKRDSGIRNMADVVAELNAAEVPTKDRSWVNEDGEVFNNSEPDFYTDLIFESRFNKVWNTKTGEEEQEVDEAMVAELKRRGKVR